MTIANSDRHIIVVPVAAWGHSRPACQLIARMAQVRSVTITYFIPKTLHHRLETELLRCFEEEDMHYKDRIRLVGLPCAGTKPLDLEVFYDAFKDVYKKLVAEEPIVCDHTGTVMPATRAPDAAILDIFAGPALTEIRKSSIKPVKAVCFAPTASFAMVRIATMWKDDIDRPNVKEYLEGQAKEAGMELDEYASQKYHGTGGRVLEYPGLPPMYDYENFPQEVTMTITNNAHIHIALLEALNACDSMLVSSPSCFDTEASRNGINEWLGRTSRPWFSAGPLLPLTKGAAAQEMTLSQDGAKILAFMEESLRSKGPKSMIFMSFGSLFWPKDPSKIWLVLDILNEMNIPYIFSHGSPDAQVPEEVLKKVEYAGVGMLTSWAPQQMILAHAATGWFITHAGFNSLIESVVAGTPMICWPFRAEQPVNAMHLTDNLDVAYELFEVRTGEHALRPVCRNGYKPVGTPEAVREEAKRVLEMAFGEDGKRKRANVEKLQKATLAAWAPGGSSWTETERFMEYLHS